MEFLIIGVIIGLVLFAGFYYLFIKNGKSGNKKQTKIEVKQEDIEILAAYVKAQKEQEEETQKLKEFKKADMKQKLEVFKQTKEQLKDKLKSQINNKEWKPLESVLKSSDKGGVGIYILYNRTKNKYYVGQAKQLFKRVREHFIIEDIAMDYKAGDNIQVKFLTANEIDDDYRLDHIEKTGIEIFDSERNGYNKTTGNL